MTKKGKVWNGLVLKKAVDQLVLLTNAAELLEKWSILLHLVKRIQNVVVVKIRSPKNEANGIDPPPVLAVQTTDGKLLFALKPQDLKVPDQIGFKYLW